MFVELILQTCNLFISEYILLAYIINLFMKKIDKELLEELWKKINIARKEKKLSQEELAKKTWIDRSYISMVERWETNITFLKLKRICDELWMDLKM
jgi:ribosome-binding protein aMBF1 (putative translation factor)